MAGERPKGVMGRPRKQPPPNAAELIREAAAQGANIRSIARAVLRVDFSVLDRWREEYPELQQALEEGRESERRALHNKLFQVATQGEGRDSIIAAMFLLKARHGYVEGEQPHQANRVAINVSLPGALPMKQIEVIENERPTVQRLPD